MWRVVTSTLGALTFVASAAAAQQPCTTDASRVVAEVYRHVLERGVDPGSNTWVQRLSNGQITVKEVVLAVAKSPEYMQRFGQAEAGEAEPLQRAVSRLYRHVLGRQPDNGGLNYWTNLAQQRGLAAVVDGFVNSEEYTGNFGDWTAPGSGGVRFCANAVPPAQSSQVAPRFRGMDRNNDGVISRGEWQGNTVSFNNQDWNKDGVLSGDEVRTGGRRGGIVGRRAGYNFDQLDVNNNNRIERREWQARLDQFNALDTNGDNFLSRAEVQGSDDFTGTSGQSRSLVVGGDRQWVDTGINVTAGDSITINAEGQIRLSRNGRDFATAAGATSGRRPANGGTIPNAAAGALVARFGDSAPVLVGDNRTVRASRAGRLYLGVNDDVWDDNTGQYNVTIDVR